MSPGMVRPTVGRNTDDKSMRKSALIKHKMNQPFSVLHEECGGPQNCDRPKVSVLMITYNHERFISQAIESVLAQKTRFEFELVVGEDFSTDGTRRICEAFATSHPQRVRLLPSTRNLGLLGNYTRTWEACRGDYVATIDGDDFWLAPDKLATQVNVLESNPRLSMCFHNARLADENGNLANVVNESATIPREIPFRDFIENGLFMPTATVMFRGGLFRQLPEWMRHLPFEDWPTHVLHATRGPIAFVPQSMSAYRIHPQGVWSGLDRLKQCKQSYEVRRAVCRELQIPSSRAQEALRCELARRVAKEQALSGRWLAATGWLARSWGHRIRAFGAAPPIFRTHLWGPVFRQLPAEMLKLTEATCPAMLTFYRGLKRRGFDPPGSATISETCTREK
jgi:glycosyltransferase involved in cell wall biosynthesis